MKKFCSLSFVFFFCFSIFLIFIAPSVPVSAAESDTYLYNGFPFPALPSGTSYSAICFHPLYATLLLDCTSIPTADFVDGAPGLSFSSPGLCNVYQFDGCSWVVLSSYSYDSTLSLGLLADVVFYWSSFDLYNSASHLYFPGSDPVVLGSDAGPSEPSVPVHGDGIYYQAYDLLSEYVYGIDSADLSSDQQLTLTAVSTVCCLFLVSLPFLLVWFVIKIFR